MTKGITVTTNNRWLWFRPNHSETLRSRYSNTENRLQDSQTRHPKILFRPSLQEEIKLNSDDHSAKWETVASRCRFKVNIRNHLPPFVVQRFGVSNVLQPFSVCWGIVDLFRNRESEHLGLMRGPKEITNLNLVYKQWKRYLVADSEVSDILCHFDVLKNRT